MQILIYAFISVIDELSFNSNELIGLTLILRSNKSSSLIEWVERIRRIERSI